MDKARNDAGRVASLAALACVLAACNPAPAFPPAEQPLVGVVVIERELFESGEVLLGVGRVPYGSLRVPPGAVPPGTRLLVRLLRDVAKTLPDSSIASTWFVGGQTAAIQILPATVTFTAPASLTLEAFLPSGWEAQVLHADEGDRDWQIRGAAAVTADPIRPRPGGPYNVTAAIDAPHLWSFQTTPARDAAAAD